VGLDARATRGRVRPYPRRYRLAMDLSLFFAGTGGSTPAARRGLPAVLVRRGGDRVLFDCGEGTQRQLLRSIGLADVDSVFITHFHADHWLGLPGMLKSFALRERELPLAVYGPRGLAELMGVMRIVYGRLPFELSVVELEAAQAVERDGYRIAPVRVQHGGREAFGYVLVEDERPGEFDPRAAERLGVSPGPDFGCLQRGQSVGGVSPEQVMGPPREGRKVVFSGDTAPCEALGVAAHEADVLVHEATFAAEEVDRARETAHSTARQAGELARDAGVRVLALTHISSRYIGREIRDEARAIFAATVAPRDFDRIEIPFPERGPATLVRWTGRRGGDASEGDETEGPAKDEAAPRAEEPVSAA
jgi:ribonuclease Z